MKLRASLTMFFVMLGTSWATTFTVNNTADLVDANPGDGVCETSPGNGVCTLRAAIQEAGASANSNTIVLPAGTYVLSATPACIYTLVSDPIPGTENMSALCVKGSVTITGAGSDSTIIDAGGSAGVTCCGGYPSARGMVIPVGAVVNVSGVTIRNGKSNGGFTWFGGAAINNQGTLALSNSVLAGNVGLPGGGGIWNDGKLIVDGVSFSGNSAGGYGGAGLYNTGTGIAELSGSSFDLNTSQSLGGAIVNAGTLKILATSITNNIATGNAGAIYNSATLTLTNVTIAANQAPGYAAIWNAEFGTATANNTTIALNHASSHIGGITSGKTFTIWNSILAGNFDDSNPSVFSDCEGTITSQGHNVISGFGSTCKVTGATATDIFGKDPGLAPLAVNGATTQTLALLSSSPALDAGDPSTPGTGGTACAAADQRGIFRPQNGRCDIGAFERIPGLSATGIMPPSAGNSGPLVAIVSGSGIQSGASVRLSRSGQSDIVGSLPTVNPGNAQMSAAFDLTNAQLGPWDVVITNPDDSRATLPGKFLVQTAGAPQIWAQFTGPDAVRPGGTVTYTLQYGNRGNVEAEAVPIIVSVPSTFQPVIYVALAQPPAQAGQIATDWTNVPIHLQPGPDNGRYNLGFLIPVIPPESGSFLRLTVVIPGSLQHGQTFTISGLPGTAFYNNGSPSSDAVSQLVSSAITYAKESFGIDIPASRIPAMTQYATNQLQLAVASGRQSLVAALATQPAVYSLGQLNIDLAQFGAGSFGVFDAHRVKSIADEPFSTSLLAPRLRSHADPGTSPPTRCSGQVLDEGKSCFGGGVTPNPGPDPAPCSAVGLFNLVSTGSTGGACNPKNNDCDANPGACPNPNPVDSVDPNAKSGPPGPGSQHYVMTGPAFTYQIEFQNKPDASAPAQQVIVTDQLDTSTLDLNTFRLGPISFGAYTLTPPAGATQFSGGLDLRPSMNVIAKVDASLNAATGLLTWHFTSLDPDTEQLTQNALAGFLPPDAQPPAGEGTLTYTIAPKSGIANGATICNQATVVFDTNAPISTQNWCNTIDSVSPTSSVHALPHTETAATFPVQWSGNDAGAGIRDYTIYVSDNGGAFSPWLTNTSSTSGSYAGASGHSYGFYSIARDSAGNVEGPKNTADTSTSVGGNPLCATDVSKQFNIARGGYRYNNATQRFQQVITITRTAAGSLAGPFVLAVEQLSSNASVYSPSGTTTCIAPGSAYVTLNPGASWGAGQSLLVTLEFVDPGRTGITYTPALLAGATR